MLIRPGRVGGIGGAGGNGGDPDTFRPGVGAITITGYAPTPQNDLSVTPAAGAITITGYAPEVHSSIAAADAGAITITGYAPTLETFGYNYLNRSMTTNVAGTTTTFSSVNLGRAFTGRILVLGICVRAHLTTASTVTVGGNSCTSRVAQTTDLFGGSHKGEVSIWTLALDSGTSGDIVITATGSGADFHSYALWSLEGYDEIPGDTASHQRGGSSTIDVAAGDFLIGMALGWTSTGGQFAWNANIDEVFDEGSDPYWGGHGGADRYHSSASTGMAVTSSDNATQFSSTVFAAFNRS